MCHFAVYLTIVRYTTYCFYSTGLCYYDRITFIVQATGANVIKHFTAAGY
jgi:hypothetical protein